MDVIFLSLEEILEIHQNQINLYGGELAIRDITLLESAIAMPYAGFGEHYMHEDIFDMAAAYLFHIVQNHPFVDGNKRTGAASAYVFLAMNDLLFDVSEDKFVSLVLEIANGKMGKPAIAQYLRENSSKD